MLEADDRFIVVVLAMAIDVAVGDPRWLWGHVPHPVRMTGWAVDWLDRTFNLDEDPPEKRRLSGIFAIAGLVAGAIVVGWLLALLIGLLPYAAIIEAVIVAILLAGRSLYDHVADVAKGLVEGGLEGGREAVRHIVGRDAKSLDESGVARASIESAAENFSDALVAPVFWYAIFGLPGILAYKAVNTADSMIGYRTARYEAFGKAAARLDDVLNWLPARLSGALIAFAAWLANEDGEGAVRAMWRDASLHRSPNAGWPEAAMGGALGLALAGPRRYGGRVVEDAWMNRDGSDEADAEDINRALRLLVWSMGVLAGFLGLMAFLF